MKRFGLILLIFVSLLLLIAIGKTLLNTSVQKEFSYQEKSNINKASIQHLQQAIRFKTISYDDPSRVSADEFKKFQDFLRLTYPLFHSRLSKEVLVGYSLLFKWKGKNETLKPILLMAHQDVVPIEEGTEKLWTVDPFKGEIKDDFIWGRGAIDNKSNLIAIFESTETLLHENFQPERTIYFFFGHDEEKLHLGAVALSKLFAERKIELDLILDEGGIITEKQIPGIKRPVALIATSEKGFLSLELSVQLNGGHSSMPAKETAIDILSHAILKLRSNPFDAKITESVDGFIQQLGPEMSWMQRLAFSNLWLFRPIVIRTYEKSAPGNAMIRTTIAPTILQAGLKDNVIPTQANATINFRILPGESTETVTRRVKEIIDDERVEVNHLRKSSTEPSAVTSMEHFAYRKVEESIKSSYQDILTAPFLMIGRTDSRYVSVHSQGIIRFSPLVDPIGFHGIDERLRISSFRTAIQFYIHLMENCQKN